MLFQATRTTAEPAPLRLQGLGAFKRQWSFIPRRFKHTSEVAQAKGELALDLC